jgi:hypothetical protein
LQTLGRFVVGHRVNRQNLYWHKDLEFHFIITFCAKSTEISNRKRVKYVVGFTIGDFSMNSDSRSPDPRSLNDAFRRDVQGTANYNSEMRATLQKQHAQKAAEFNKSPAGQKGSFKK